MFAALAHPARRQILLTIHFRGGELTAGDIARRFEHAWPTTTRHLDVLAAAGLVSRRKEGKAVIYTVQYDALAIVGEWTHWFEVSPDAVDSDRPTPKE